MDGYPGRRTSIGRDRGFQAIERVVNREVSSGKASGRATSQLIFTLDTVRLVQMDSGESGVPSAKRTVLDFVGIISGQLSIPTPPEERAGIP